MVIFIPSVKSGYWHVVLVNAHRLNNGILVQNLMIEIEDEDRQRIRVTLKEAVQLGPSNYLYTSA